MATVLGEALSHEHRMLLGQLSAMPGFEILKLLMSEMCEVANQRVIKVDPEKPDYEKVLSRQQLMARAINDCCSSILQSVDYQKAKAIVEEDEQYEPALKILREKETTDPSDLQSNN